MCTSIFYSNLDIQRVKEQNTRKPFVLKFKTTLYGQVYCLHIRMRVTTHCMSELTSLKYLMITKTSV